ncbi:glutathione S-transferase family protein [Marinimicrococcus flavescens]|uniref:Glutathione S-transferase family protein n=1 Tax=Marinimicrococcus flavescens TaxID=3031815 RepID=A0AAP3XRV7_9PROT|nr:glutathione S-transferase family protein [Marinimicrococcus flavescens]
MSLVLYAHPVSNFCAKVEIVLRLKNLAYAIRLPPGGYGSPEYRAIVPTGTIPALVDDKLVLAESETINEYLEEAYPEPPLLPEGTVARALARQLARFHDTRLEPVLRGLFPQMDPAVRDRSAVAAAAETYRKRLHELALLAKPSPWLGGPRIGLADAAYPATLLMGDMMLAALGERAPLPDSLVAWRRALDAHPAAAPVLERSREALEEWLRRKNAA